MAKKLTSLPATLSFCHKVAGKSMVPTALSPEAEKAAKMHRQDNE
jgi:hypothetical protein